MKEKFSKLIEVRKIIALIITVLFCFISIYGIINGIATFSDIVPITTMVIGYYFGKSTALDKPGEKQ